MNHLKLSIGIKDKEGYSHVPFFFCGKLLKGTSNPIAGPF
jgi:hypothetical protein